MKIRIVSHKTDILTLNPNEKFIHIAFRPSMRDILMLIESCPKVESIQIPPSYMEKLAESIKIFLQMQRIELKEGTEWGFRSDISEYIEVPDVTA